MVIVLDIINVQMSKHVSSGACVLGRGVAHVAFQLLQPSVLQC